METIGFYTALGFTLAFVDNADEPNYVGFRRDAVELHMQFQFEHEMGTIRLRFLVDDPDTLFDEYRQLGVECTPGWRSLLVDAEAAMRILTAPPNSGLKQTRISLRSTRAA